MAAFEDEAFLMPLPGNQMKSLWDDRWDIIAFKDAIKGSIYWGNQWLWHTEDLIVWKKGHFWACSFFLLKDSPSLRLAVITVEIYITKDDYLLLSSWIMTCRPSGNRSPGCLRYLPPFSTSSEYSINRCTPVVCTCTRTHAKQKITVGLGLCLFMPCQYRNGSHQKSSLICLPGNHGKPWEDWTHMQSKEFYNGLFIYIGLCVKLFTPLHVCFQTRWKYLCESYSMCLCVFIHPQQYRLRSPAIAICG